MNSTILSKNLLALRVLQNQSFSTIKQNIISNSTKANRKIDVDTSRHQIKQSYKNERFHNSTENIKVNDRDIHFSQFLASSRSDPDNFGTLSDDWKMHQRLKDMPEEKDDVVENEFLNNREGKRRLTTNQYGRIIKKFLVQKKVS